MNTKQPSPRTPRERAAPRLGPLATLPLFHKLQGREVLLAGGSPGAAWKAELLSSAGAVVHVFAAEPGEAMLALASERPDLVQITPRGWSAPDLHGKALAIGDIEDMTEARAFAAAAQVAGVTFNVVDKPDLCDVQFGAIVNRSPLVIGISTDGAAPVFGQAVRMRIETLLPEGFARWARAARAWRERIGPLAWPFRQRRDFWEAFTARAFSQPKDEPTLRDFEELREASDAGAAALRTGRIAIVGAGPGDPDLLTLAAVRELQAAEVVLYDDLVTAEVLAVARREARKIAVGKRGGRASCGQDDICREMLDHARKGSRVVRLKGGDPAIFGRLDEELDAARAAGFEPVIVPGVTTASGVAASLGISLTRRRLAPRLQFVTAHGAEGGLPPGLDLDALADPAATTCIYMGRRTLPLLASALIARGLSRETPVRIVIDATRPGMEERLTRLGNAAAVAATLRADAPCVILLGAAAAGRACPEVPARKARSARGRVSVPEAC
jgi:uroporphyrin-III C-methyltransferase/precorrin-2 dehydrogenase/sirohydrochlorin ferrochelatase